MKGTLRMMKICDATTSTFRPNRARIKILQQSRQLSDIHVGQSREIGLHPCVIQVPFYSLIIQFVVAVEDEDSGETWLCDASPVMEQIHLTVCITLPSDSFDNEKIPLRPFPLRYPPRVFWVIFLLKLCCLTH